MKLKLGGLLLMCGRDAYGHLKIAVQVRREKHWAGPMVLHYKKSPTLHIPRLNLYWRDNLDNVC